MDHVIKGFEYVDFEKINSLEGVFVTNIFDIEKHHSLKNKQTTTTGTGKNRKKTTTVEFDEAEMDEEKIEKMQRN